MFIEEIVKKISRGLDLHKKGEIPLLIGMESSIRAIICFLTDESSDRTEIFTIWGMAGIGKTSLAKYIFKLYYLDFERSSFLEDIERRCTQPNGLLDLQKQLLKDIQNRSWMDIHNTNVGTFKVEKSLARKRTLVVLDGIDKFDQLDMLIGTKGIHLGSKILITSKNGSLTERCRLFDTKVLPKHTKHLFKGLNENESIHLLCWHAFRWNYPTEGDKNAIVKLVKYCQGHPLALKVLGSSLYNEDTTWEDVLQSLGKEMNSNIRKVLQISFDSLPYEKDKELFKHIACLFIGKDREFTEEILKACGICKSSGINNLINRCLLTIEPNNNLMMHQLLQDIGRDMVLQESPKTEKRSLLWHHDECLAVLRKRKGMLKVQGLVLDMKLFENGTLSVSSVANKRHSPNDLYDHFRPIALFQRVCFLLSALWWLFGQCFSFHHQNGGLETHAFSQMCNLRLLQLNYLQLKGSYKNFPDGLRWLCMHGFPLGYIPSDLHMENMVALDMSNSKLQQLWKTAKLVGLLKFLDLSCCRELISIGNFSGLPLLERLILAGCVSLVKVCKSIGDCDKLIQLDLSGCTKLKMLPKSIGKLRSLRTLSINGCLHLCEFPVEIKDMESLEVLEANNLNIKTQISSSTTVEVTPRITKCFVISLPCSLVKLSLRNSNLADESFPIDFSSLSMLKSLILDENPIEAMPDCVRSLSRVEYLSLKKCYCLKTVLCAPSTIKVLHVDNCFLLEKITYHQEMSEPPLLLYHGTYSLSKVGGLFKMQAITDIDEEILQTLGWINIEYEKYNKFAAKNCSVKYRYKRKPLPAQMLYELGIFSTNIKGKEVPNWFTRGSNGSSFILHSTPKSSRIQGLNVCIVYTFPTILIVDRFLVTITNLTKNCYWTYYPQIFAVREANEDVIVWLSHWMFRNNEFEDGDEVSVFARGVKNIVSSDTGCFGIDGLGEDGVYVKECGISLVYDEGNTKEDILSCYSISTHSFDPTNGFMK